MWWQPCLVYHLHPSFWSFSSSSEIPQYRLPYSVVDFEVELAKDIGVKVRFIRHAKVNSQCSFVGCLFGCPYVCLFAVWCPCLFGFFASCSYVCLFVVSCLFLCNFYVVRYLFIKLNGFQKKSKQLIFVLLLNKLVVGIFKQFSECINYTSF